MTVRRIGKWLLWIVAGCFALVALLYFYILLVNRHDQPPSAAVVRFEALQRAVPAVADQDNGFVYFMGFSAQKGLDPQAVGMQRIAWAKAWLAQSKAQAVSDYPGEKHDVSDTPDDAVMLLAVQCKIAGPGCADALESNKSAAEQWLAREQWLGERYQVLLAYPAWRETLPYDARLPAYSFASLLDGQRMHLLTAWMRAGRGDTAGVRKLLQDDMQFWRRNLAANDMLISKLISASAIKRHFAWSNIILRRLPSDKVAAAIPPQWRDPISDAERSMLRSFAGELAISSINWTQIAQCHVHAWPCNDNPLFAPLRKSLFQLQDTRNRQADLWASTADALAVGYEQLPAAVPNVRARTEGIKRTWFAKWGYNTLGDILFRVSIPDIARYGEAVADLEGVRRATLLMSDFRSRGMTAAQIPEQLAAARIGSPYDGKPFPWDADAKAIVFTGLLQGERGRTAIPY